jgi:hypothetical protein
MDFSRHCAALLDGGEEAETVLALMRQRYTTVRCMNVKACLVRRMCKLSDEYVCASAELYAAHPHLRDVSRSEFAKLSQEDQQLLRALPPRLPRNVEQLRLSHKQVIECIVLGRRSALEKNRRRVRVDGRKLLAEARWTLFHATSVRRTSRLAFALMLVTGRRTCELMNGTSTFVYVDRYTIRFTGQAKRRIDDVEILVPVLAPAEVVVAAFARLRQVQRHVQLSNMETSRRYQSLLSRDLAADPLWAQCRRVHALRGIYTCMALRLFTWDSREVRAAMREEEEQRDEEAARRTGIVLAQRTGAGDDDDASDAYVAMCILGHTGLVDSLVYTPYHVGDDFGSEPQLGRGRFSRRVNTSFRETGQPGVAVE